VVIHCTALSLHHGNHDTGENAGLQLSSLVYSMAPGVRSVIWWSTILLEITSASASKDICHCIQVLWLWYALEFCHCCTNASCSLKSYSCYKSSMCKFLMRAMHPLIPINEIVCRLACLTLAINEDHAKRSSVLSATWNGAKA
jgi:hypothetical protein